MIKRKRDNEDGKERGEKRKRIDDGESETNKTEDETQEVGKLGKEDKKEVEENIPEKKEKSESSLLKVFHQHLQNTNKLATQGTSNLKAVQQFMALYQKAKTEPKLLEDLGWGSEELVWLLFSTTHLLICEEEFSDAKKLFSLAFQDHKDQCIGNPFFHLLVGKVKWAESSPTATNDLTRALICGGLEMFSDEDPKYMEKLKSILKLPAGCVTWDEFSGGCLVDRLNSASGFMAETVLKRKFGVPPPYSSK